MTTDESAFSDAGYRLDEAGNIVVNAGEFVASIAPNGTIEIVVDIADSEGAPEPDPEQLLRLRAALVAVESSRGAQSGYWAARATVNGDLGELDEAIRDWTRAIDLADSPVIRIARAHALCSLGRHGEAVRDYDAAIALDPTVADVYFEKGKAEARLEEYELAFASFTKDLEASRDEPSATTLFNRHSVLRQLGRHSEACADLDSAIALEPDRAEFFVARSYLRATLGDIDGALMDARTGVELDSDVIATHVALARAAEAHGDALEAMKQWYAALALDPDDVESLNNRARIFLAIKRYDYALKDLQRLLDLQPNVPAHHSNVGWALDQAGRKEDAERRYRHALELDPTYSNARLNLAALLAAAGRVEEARSDYEILRDQGHDVDEALAKCDR